MGSIDILHLLNDLLFFVDILVEAKNLQTIGAEEGLQFSKAQLEERLESSFRFGRRRLGIGFRGVASVGWRRGGGGFIKAGPLIRRERAAHRSVIGKKLE